jgi:hypothetical protein
MQFSQAAPVPPGPASPHIATLQASELSRFIDEELLKDGKDGELAKLLARQNSQRVRSVMDL